MLVLFIDTEPSPGLRRDIEAGGGTAYTGLWPSGSPAPDLIAVKAVQPSADRLVSQLAALRRQYPSAWIAAIVPRKRLEDRAFARTLFQCPVKDDVWSAGSWEALFWFSVQRAQREQRIRAGLPEAAEGAIHGEWAPLHDASGHLVRQLEHDIELASHIQRSLLPKSFPNIPGVSLTAKYLPATAVGGDYYDIFEFGDRRRFGILLADSRTHGMAAALLSVLLKVRLDEMKERFPDSRSLLLHLHQELHQIDPKERASLSVLYGILDRHALTFDYTAAGHLHPLLWRQDHRAEPAASATPALGEGQAPLFNEGSLQLRPGDLLLFHTDGLSQILSTGPSSPESDLERVLLSKGPLPDPLDVQADLMGLISQHREKAELPDDVTILQFAIGPRALYLSHSR
jgi:serine phosphatase RsbU (regulator of sigma subunit)